MFQKLVILTISCFFIEIVKTLPPTICNVPFRFDDCGKDPQPVMYYYKAGSRCEVGFWKGCIPNPNMFRDEFECASTCIMGYVQVQAKDFHNLNDIEEDYGLVTEYVPSTEKVTRPKPNTTTSEASSMDTTTISSSVIVPEVKMDQSPDPAPGPTPPADTKPVDEKKPDAPPPVDEQKPADAPPPAEDKKPADAPPPAEDKKPDDAKPADPTPPADDKASESSSLPTEQPSEAAPPAL